MDSVFSILGGKLNQKNNFAKKVKTSISIETANSLMVGLWGKKFEAEAVSIRNKTLKIRCGNQVVAQEVKFRLNRIKDAINEKAGDKVILKVMIVQEPIEKRSL